MKKLNSLFIILLCCVGAMSVTSCLGDDDDYGLDPETYRQYLTLMSGMYYGDSSKEEYKNKIYFFNDTITDKENENKQDAVGNISLAISAQDTTFAISNVPGKIFTKEGASSASYDKNAFLVFIRLHMNTGSVSGISKDINPSASHAIRQRISCRSFYRKQS